MEVTRSAIHKLQVKADCTCQSSAEYTDPAYKKPVGEIQFTPCEAHKGKDGVEFLAGLLKEAVQHEAATFTLPPAIERPVRPTVNRSGEVKNEDGGTVVTPAARPERNMRPVGPAIPRVIGGTTGLRRVDPSSLVKRPSQVRAAAGGASKVAAVAGMGTDMDPVPEDPRITKLIKDEGIEDLFENTDTYPDNGAGGVDDGDDDGEFDLDFD